MSDNSAPPKDPFLKRVTLIGIFLGISILIPLVWELAQVVHRAQTRGIDEQVIQLGAFYMVGIMICLACLVFLWEQYKTEPK